MSPRIVHFVGHQNLVREFRMSPFDIDNALQKISLEKLYGHKRVHLRDAIPKKCPVYDSKCNEQWRRTYGCSGCTCTHSFPAPPRNYLHKCTSFSAPPRSCTYTCTHAIQSSSAPVAIFLVWNSVKKIIIISNYIFKQLMIMVLNLVNVTNF